MSVSSPPCRRSPPTLKFHRQAAAEAIAYSDRPVAIEPGLSLDVLPIANMLTKLALMELLADTIEHPRHPEGRLCRTLVSVA